jgi:DNA-directed RNA polymerase specialized sigma24 family protein
MSSLSESGHDLPFEDLVRALRAGDAAAWTRVFDQVLPRVTAALRHDFGAAVARPENAGGQAMASACRTIYRHITKGDFHLHDWNDLAGLFICIATNKCVDKLKDERRLRTQSDLGHPPGAQEDGPPAEPSAAEQPLDAVLRNEALQEFRRVVDLVRRRLKWVDPKYSGIFKLRLEGTYTNGQIAEAVGCSTATAKRAWAYAVGLCKTLLDESVVEQLRR